MSGSEVCKAVGHYLRREALDFRDGDDQSFGDWHCAREGCDYSEPNDDHRAPSNSLSRRKTARRSDKTKGRGL